PPSPIAATKANHKIPSNWLKRATRKKVGPPAKPYLLDPTTLSYSRVGRQAGAELAMTLLEEPLRAIRRRIAERRHAGHHLGEEPAGRRAERQAPVAVAIGEPEPALARCARDHRAGIGKARARSQPRLRLDRFAERKQFARLRQQAIELHRRRRRIACGEFGTRGDADALLHRRQAIAVFGIEHGATERGISLRAEMTV